ncbi:MAG: Arylsulfatase [candidate division BRC1 bacterium ADurb.BinA364]|nr:MAG: Arylsulfatase [candidate division BRC1 bacterium ADurb.BinA364]
MNILVIAVDTLRWDHLAHNRAKPVKTPNLDRFAERATLFERCIVNSFPTVPHRMDCFTGRVCFPNWDWEQLPKQLPTLTETLRDAGYFTAVVADTTNFISANITRGAHEIHRTLLPPADMPDPKTMPFPVPPEHIRQRGAQRQKHAAEQAHFRRESDWWVAKTMTRAAEWLQDNAKRDKWFLWVDTFEVHELWHTPQYYVDKYDPGYTGLDYDFPNYGYTDIYSETELRHLWAHYAAEVTLTDRWIGHLLDQVDVMGLWDDTMLVVTSDHGMYIGEHNRTGKHTVLGEADPWPLYEEVTHVPMMVWAPGLGAEGKRIAALAQPADLAPTILDAARVAAPPMDGRSWLPLIAGERKRNWDVVYSAKHWGPNARLTICPTWVTATTEQWTAILAQEKHEAELYDIQADPGQRNNLAQRYPDIEPELRKDFARFMRSQGAAEEYIARYE